MTSDKPENVRVKSRSSFLSGVSKDVGNNEFTFCCFSKKVFSVFTVRQLQVCL